jgi:CBS domain containing-hemolysin-like protein
VTASDWLLGIVAALFFALSVFSAFAVWAVRRDIMRVSARELTARAKRRITLYGRYEYIRAWLKLAGWICLLSVSVGAILTDDSDYVLLLAIFGSLLFVAEQVIGLRQRRLVLGADRG